MCFIRRTLRVLCFIFCSWLFRNVQTTICHSDNATRIQGANMSATLMYQMFNLICVALFYKYTYIFFYFYKKADKRAFSSLHVLKIAAHDHLPGVSIFVPTRVVSTSLSLPPIIINAKFKFVCLSCHS